MDDPHAISASPAPPDRDLYQNEPKLVPPRDLALAGAISKRPAPPVSRPLRILLAGHIDRQFPLVRSA